MESILVIGAGFMGSGIAQVCAQAGVQVFLNDVSQEALDRAMKNISWSVGKLIEKGTLTEAAETITGRIKQVKDFNAASTVDLVIEAVFENLGLKQEVFKKLDQACGSETLMASNTSAIPITELAAATTRPDKVLASIFLALSLLCRRSRL